VLIALDRQEKGNGELSAIQEVEKEFGIPVVSIIRLEQVLDFLKANPEFAGHAEKVASYRDHYGV
jgi:orotate phosphoribosyltransferase